MIIYTEGAKKMYTHFTEITSLKMCIHFWHPLYICVCVCVCVLYIYIYVQRVPKMYTHFT